MTDASPDAWLLTFDDGGASAITHTAPALEARNWRGHFFMTVGQLGTPEFLGPAALRDLHRRGHVIGSHTVWGLGVQLEPEKVYDFEASNDRGVRPGGPTLGGDRHAFAVAWVTSDRSLDP